MPAAARSWHLSGVLPVLVFIAGTAAAAQFLSPERALRLAAAALVLASIAYLAWNMQPAYLLCGAVAASCFSGNWELLGFPGSLAPDRLLLIGGMGMVLIRSAGARNRPRLELRLPHLLLILAGVYAIASAVWVETITDRSALFRLTDRFGLVPFAAFAIAPLAFRTRGHRRALIATLAALGAYLSLTALLEMIDATSLIYPPFIADPDVGLHFGRARGPFLEAQAMGLALFTCAVGCFVGWQYWRRRTHRFLLGAIALMCLAGTFFTLQRAVWVGVVVGSVAGLLSVPRLQRLILPAAAGGTVLVLVLLAVVPGLSDKVSDRTGTRGQRALWDRENLNSAAVRLIGANPVFGIGWERWQDRAEPFFITDPDHPLTGSVNGRIQVVHNVYLSNAAELGLLGAGLWLLAVLTVLAAALRRRGPPDIGAWRAGLAAIGAMWLTVMLFTPLGRPFTTLVVFVWAGVVYGAGWAERRPEPQVPAQPERGGRSGPVPVGASLS